MKQSGILVLVAVASGAAVVAIGWRTVGGSDPAPAPALLPRPVVEAQVHVAPAVPPVERLQPQVEAMPAVFYQPRPPPQELLEAIRRAKADVFQKDAASAPAQSTPSFEEAIAIAHARQQPTRAALSNPFGPAQK